MKFPLAAILAISIFTGFTFAYAQSDEEDEPDLLDEVLVTGAMRVTAGGAQDMAFARSEILSGRIPHPDTFTDEGLLSQHDLPLPDSDTCDQLFCVFGEAMQSDLVSKPGDRYFVGLGFSSNLDAETWQRSPVNVVAVVDKSGSMDGEPLALVRRSLLGLVSQMHAADQLSIVLYGDHSHVYLEPTRLSDDDRTKFVREQIKTIESAGSTNMEEGLQIGYQLARETQPAFEGSTRLILFTDERPNVGNTSATGFIGMAKAASKQGIGLTTIGVGVQFDSSLATKLSSTRGGNLFFLPNAEAADKIFADEFEFMVSELAHDLVFTLRPHPDLAITGVYGLPGDMLSWADHGAVTFTIPTVFLSSRGGGVFVSLGLPVEQADLPSPIISSGDNVLAAAITYMPVDGQGGPQSDLAEITPHGSGSSDSMRLASLLVDEYVGLRRAATEHYIRNDQEAAYQALQVLYGRLQSVRGRGLKKKINHEVELVGRLLEKVAYLSGHSSEVSQSKGSELWGVWKITSARRDELYDEAEAGELMIFSPDNRVLIVEEQDYADLDWGDAEPYAAGRAELYFPDSPVRFAYETRGSKMTLRVPDDRGRNRIQLILRRLGPFPMESFVPADSDDLGNF